MKRITDLLQFLLAGGDWKLPSDEARDRLLNDDVGHNIIGRRVQRDAGLGVVHLNSGHAVLLSMAFWVCMAQTVWTKNAGDKKYGKPPRFSHIFAPVFFCPVHLSYTLWGSHSQGQSYFANNTTGLFINL